MVVESIRKLRKTTCDAKQRFFGEDLRLFLICLFLSEYLFLCVVFFIVLGRTEGLPRVGSWFQVLSVSFLHRGLPTLQRGLKVRLPQRFAKVVIHPCRETLFAFSRQGVSRQGDDVDRRLPRAR
jgi:hypothetical protein